MLAEINSIYLNNKTAELLKKKSAHPSFSGVYYFAMPGQCQLLNRQIGLIDPFINIYNKVVKDCISLICAFEGEHDSKIVRELLSTKTGDKLVFYTGEDIEKYYKKGLVQKAIKEKGIYSRIFVKKNLKTQKLRYGISFNTDDEFVRVAEKEAKQQSKEPQVIYYKRRNSTFDHSALGRNTGATFLPDGILVQKLVNRAQYL